MMTEKELIEQLFILKAQTVRTGILHEAQVLQLQMWPRVVFEKSIASVAEVSDTKKLVLFNVTVSKKPSIKVIKESVEKLTDWCRSILWDETVVDVKFTEVSDVRNSRKSKRKSAKASSRRRT